MLVLGACCCLLVLVLTAELLSWRLEFYLMLDCLLLSWSFEFETTKTSMCCTVMLAATIMLPFLLLV